MSAARIEKGGKVRPLDGKAEPDVVVTENDLEPPQLTRLLARILKDIATLKRRYVTKRIDFEDITVAVSSVTQLQHNFNGRVRWWVVDWVSTGAGNATQFETHASSDLNTLRLFSGEAGIATIRVEAAG